MPNLNKPFTHGFVTALTSGGRIKRTADGTAVKQANTNEVERCPVTVEEATKFAGAMLKLDASVTAQVNQVLPALQASLK